MNDKQLRETKKEGERMVAPASFEGAYPIKLLPGLFHEGVQRQWMNVPILGKRETMERYDTHGLSHLFPEDPVPKLQDFRL